MNNFDINFYYVSVAVHVPFSCALTSLLVAIYVLLFQDALFVLYLKDKLLLQFFLSLNFLF